MGRELDSLSDVVGFGVAPAYMLYVNDLQGLGWLGYIPLLAFAVLGAFRLALLILKRMKFTAILKVFLFQQQVV